MINPACASTAGGCSRAGPLPSPSPAWLQKLPRSSRTSSAQVAAVVPRFTAINAPRGSVVGPTLGDEWVSIAGFNSPRP